MNVRPRVRDAAALCLLLPLLSVSPASGQSAKGAPKPAAKAPAPTRAVVAPATDRLDAVAATVNDDVVLESDVEEQLFLFVQRSGARPDSSQVDTLRRQILDQLIDEKLVIGEAKRQGLTASDAEVSKQVDQAIAEVKERVGGEEGFRAQLARENTTEARLREKYRTELTRQLLGKKLMERQFPRRPVPLDEAIKYFEANRAKFPRVPGEIRLAVVQIPPQADSAADLAGRRRIEALRKRIAAGEKFAKVAQEASEDPSSARGGGDLGFFVKGAMEPVIEQYAFTAKLNTLSAPLRSAYGWHLVEVLERDSLKTVAGRDSLGPDGQRVVEAHARHILLRITPNETDIARAQATATRVRDEARKGTPFGTLVRRYSKFDGPADAEGDVGFVSVASLQPNIRAGLDTLEIGEVSDVLANQAGFNIFKVVDRKPERDYTVDEIRNELPEAVAQAQFRDKYETWLKGLRAKAQVEIRMN